MRPTEPVHRGDAHETPIAVEYSPHRSHPLLPVEVLDRSEVLSRTGARHLASRQRAGFHQLVVCTAGRGVHHVDFQPVELSTGTLLRIYPGQVQWFASEHAFEARMVVWPVESHYADPSGPAWFPGSGIRTRWQADSGLLARVLAWVEELRVEQERFDGSARQVELLRALLAALLMRLAIEFPETSTDTSRLPRAYLDFRELVEERVYQRPTVGRLARDLGYSSRTLDRACLRVSGQTAKQVLDERVGLEVRRLLAQTDTPIARVGAEFGFDDPSNFSKFVKRHLGRSPGELREESPHGWSKAATPGS